MDAQATATQPAHPAADPPYLAVLLALAAPVSVVVVLEATASVLAAFLVYHVLLCLVAPLSIVAVQAPSRSAFLARFGLEACSRRGWIAGGLGGVLSAAGLFAGLIGLQDVLFAEVPLAEQVAAWGIEPGAKLGLLVYMVVVNSGAEELLWRGYLQTEARARLGPAASIGLLTLAFTSYHLYTMLALVENPALATLGAAGVFAGGATWAILRERFGSLLPALLAHVGATAGYMLAFLLLV